MGEALAGQDLSWDLGYWVRPEGSWSQQRKNSRVDTGGLGEAKQRPSKAKRKTGESTVGGGGRQAPEWGPRSQDLTSTGEGGSCSWNTGGTP
jgi:hypothetical protein